MNETLYQIGYKYTELYNEIRFKMVKEKYQKRSAKQFFYGYRMDLKWFENKNTLIMGDHF